MDETIYGNDISNEWTGNGSGDLKLTKGWENLTQSVYNRLMTEHDELIDLLYFDYGTNNILSEPATPENILKQVVYIEDSLLRDPRISDVVVKEMTLTRDNMLEIRLDVTGIEENVPTNIVTSIKLPDNTTA